MKTISPNKRVIFGSVVFFMLLINPVLTSAQVVGGGGGQTYNNAPTSNSNLSKDDLYSSFSFEFVLPQGTFSQHITNPGGNFYPFIDLTKPFKGLDGLGANTGYAINYTMFASFNKFQMGGNTQGRVGLQFGLELGYIPVSWSNVSWSHYQMTVSTSGYLYDGIKIGPQFNINPSEDMGISFYVTMDPYLTFPGGENATYNGSGANYTYTGTYDVTDSSAVHLNIDASAGISFYYKALIIGIEYNWVHSKYNGSVKHTETQTFNNGSVFTPIAYNPFTSVIQMNMLKFMIGLRFGGHQAAK